MKEEKIFKLSTNKIQAKIISEALIILYSIATKEYYKWFERIPITTNCKQNKYQKTLNSKTCNFYLRKYLLDMEELSESDIKLGFKNDTYIDKINNISIGINNMLLILPKNRNYVMEFRYSDLCIIRNALECLTRTGTYQFSIALETAYRPLKKTKKMPFGLGFFEFRTIEFLIRNSLGCTLEQNSYYGIHSKSIKNKYRIAFDLLQVIRYTLAWSTAEHKPEERDKYFNTYMGICYDAPLPISGMKLAKCKEIRMLSL
jgi:hypothetical protein